MNLAFQADVAGFQSNSQRARVLTETWAAKNLYCPNCDSSSLGLTPNYTPAVDLICRQCDEGYQLKSGKSAPGVRIVDAGYEAMIRSIRSNAAPNLVYLHYVPDFGVRNLLLIPRFFFTEASIEKRNPLAETARRAGWVGCNIRLDRIAPEGRIDVVTDGICVESSHVRDRYRALAPLREIPPSVRGWALAVLLKVHKLGCNEFRLDEIYAFESELAHEFPDNNNIRPKIRQQLQVLRDLKVLEFVGKGQYRLASVGIFGG